MTNTARPALSTTSGAALYIGALLGPSVLLLPGLAAAIAGPASILSWAGLLMLSGLLAFVFTGLGTKISSGGVAAYTAAGLGARAGRAAGWCFLVGVVIGAPVVCLIGGAYVAELLGGGQGTALVASAVLLLVVVGLTLGGARTTTGVQMMLIAVLVVLIAIAVIGSAPSAHTANWRPFAPHGFGAVGTASSALMLSFVGWEAIAPLTGRLRNPARQLPKVIGIAFAITALIYLALAVATIAVLGAEAGTAVPLADLLRVAIGTAGPIVAAVAAVALVLAATNAYLSGAMAIAADLRKKTARPSRFRDRGLQFAVVGVSFLVLGAVATGLVTTEQLVLVPTALFLAVYLGCTAAAVRVLAGFYRVAAAVALVVVAGVLAFSGWALAIPVAIVLAVYGSALRWRAPVRVTRVGATVDAECSR